MKKSFKLLVFLFTCLSVSHTDAQYITLNGNRFHDQTGEPFYPVICNYGVRLSCQNCNTGSLISGFSEGRINCNPADYTLHPNHYYGSTMEFEEPFNKGLEKIKADLIKIKQMGFNTIRTMIEFHEHKHFKMVGGSVVPDEPGGRVICIRYGSAASAGWWGDFFRIMPPYATDNNLHDILLPAIHDFLDVAAEAELHVILVTGGSYISASGDASDNRDASVENLAQAEDYRDYLEVLTDGLKNRTEILAYDLFNEMTYGTRGWDPANSSWGPQTTKKKEEICNFTAMWYDAIKAVDPNHIVSLASGDIFAVKDYDPAIMKVDLHQYHEYPYNFQQGFERWGNFFTPGQIRERWLSRFNTRLYWAKNNNPMPWMLDEIAASAWTEQGQDVFGQNTNPGAPAYTTRLDYVGRNFSQPPFSYGSYEDQIDFARQTQQMVLNHSGSGYGWWEFMWDEKSPPFNNANAFSDQYIGLLDKGDPAAQGSGYAYDNSLDRPVIAAFNTNPITQPQPGTGAMPANYYNPFGADSITNYTITGTIIDQDNMPIKDAVITAVNSWGDAWDKPIVPDRYKFSIYTFSRENGNFRLTAPIGHIIVIDPEDPMKSIDYSKFKAIYFTAPAANNNELQTWQLPDLPDGQGSNIYDFPDNDTRLQRMQGVFDKTVVDEVINSGNSPFEAAARNVLKLENTLIEATGIADFHASQAVVVEDYFIALEGSYVDIYIAPVDFNCVDFPDPAYKKDVTDVSPIEKQTLPEKSIEVRYTLLQSSMRLMPNPATDVVFIESEMKEDCYLTITDMNGKQVFSDNFNLPTKYEINVSAFAPGNYLVKAITESQTETFKLFISKN